MLFFVRRRPDDAFTERDLAKAELLGSQAVVAIENAQLYGEQQKRIEELAILFEFARGITAALSPSVIAEQLLDIVQAAPRIRAGSSAPSRPRDRVFPGSPRPTDLERATAVATPRFPDFARRVIGNGVPGSASKLRLPDRGPGW